MATGRNFSMSGIISGHHNLPIYEMSLKSDNVEFVRIVPGILKMVLVGPKVFSFVVKGVQVIF
jgi:hypothetical protein